MSKMGLGLSKRAKVLAGSVVLVMACFTSGQAEETAVAALTDAGASPAFYLPQVRPIQPGEVPLTGVHAVAQPYVAFNSAVDDAFKSQLATPREVRRLLDGLRFSEPQTVAQSWLAHRGLIAAENPEFREGVRRALAQDGAISVMEQLSGRGSYARNLRGADAAVASVLERVANDNYRMTVLKGRFLSTAQEFQTKRWGMIDRPENTEAVDFADAGPGDSLTTRVAETLQNFSPISPAHAYASPLMERVLAYGALHIVATSLETDVSTAQMAPADRRTTSCLNWAKLNLNQCVAAAHFPSEEAWCTATHAIEDVRACWEKVLPAADR
ncbi:hypothetical protein QMT40_000957 [Parvibaculaceae bacterium PLY_AMNH_Bact1]|nr:hypothetical protein QMT40_000957 [Parvibaculaceae bacterium PLY_AMNH_Bact1]